jgi:hypothetical protein
LFFFQGSFDDTGGWIGGVGELLKILIGRGLFVFLSQD